MAVSYTFYKNDGTSVSEQLPFMPATPFPDPAADFGWSVQGKTFKGWNTESDGSGTFYYTGDTIFTGTTFYAIWEAPVITYLTTDRDLTSIANAIRTKGGTSAQLAFPQGFVDAVEAIETGGGGIEVPAPMKAVAGTIILTSDSKTVHIPLGDSGITRVFCATVICADYKNWSQYKALARVIIRYYFFNAKNQINSGNQVAGITEINANENLENWNALSTPTISDGFLTLTTSRTDVVAKTSVPYIYIVIGD